MNQLREHTVTLAWGDKPTVTIPKHRVLSEFFGAYQNPPTDRFFGRWTVVHLPTGYRLAHARTRKGCQRIVEAIGDMADWSFTDPKMEFGPEFKDVCKTIRKLDQTL